MILKHWEVDDELLSAFQEEPPGTENQE
jgi:hypothetical protein